MALFSEQGYSATSIAEVASRAGVSERTFFRHFADKEEVLFSGDDELLPALLESIRSGPDGTPREVLEAALTQMALILEPQRAFLERRAEIIGSDVSLAGRELSKQYRWAGAISAALRERGYSDRQADLFAAIGFAIFREATSRWLEKGSPDGLQLQLRRTLDLSDDLFAGRL